MSENDKTFYDSDGNPCSLETLCQREPGWAASRIREERRQMVALRASLAQAEERARSLEELAEIRRRWLDDVRSKLRDVRERALSMRANPAELVRAIGSELLSVLDANGLPEARMPGKG